MIYSLTQFPVSVEVPLHGMLPLNCIMRTLVFVLHVPEHAPQLAHTVHDPSTESCIKLNCEKVNNYECD